MTQNDITEYALFKFNEILNKPVLRTKTCAQTLCLQSINGTYCK